MCISICESVCLAGKWYLINQWCKFSTNATLYFMMSNEYWKNILLNWYLRMYIYIYIQRDREKSILFRLAKIEFACQRQKLDLNYSLNWIVTQGVNLDMGCDLNSCSANGHSSRINNSLSRIFRWLHVYLSQNPCWATTPLMKVLHRPPNHTNFPRTTSS